MNQMERGRGESWLMRQHPVVQAAIVILCTLGFLGFVYGLLYIVYLIGK